jgi:hypothetical protein
MFEKIIYAHTGDQSYLYMSIFQTLHATNSSITLIGDAANSDCPNVTHSMFYREKPPSLFDGFINNYIHLSPNGVSYELFCFERWFRIYDQMIFEGIDSCVVVDSDIMLYEDPKNFDFSGMSMDNIFGNAFMLFIPTVNSLYKYLCWLIDLFKNPENTLKLALQNSFIINSGGIRPKELINYRSLLLSDMIAVMSYMSNIGVKYGDFFFNNLVDGNFRSPVSFPDNRRAVIIDNGKEIMHAEDGAYYKCTDGVFNKISAIHFAGNNKKKMAYNFRFPHKDKIRFVAQKEKDTEIICYLNSIVS